MNETLTITKPQLLHFITMVNLKEDFWEMLKKIVAEDANFASKIETERAEWPALDAILEARFKGHPDSHRSGALAMYEYLICLEPNSK